METINGLGFRSSMSHPEATLYIHEPMFAITVAVHITRKGRSPNGVQADKEVTAGATV
jgi:hypothetical protein